MAMIIVMVLVAQDAFVGSANPVTAFIIMDGSEQAFPAASDLMAMLVIVIGVCPEQAGTAVSDLVAVLVIMIHAIRQDARAAEDLLHGFRLLSANKKAGAGNGSCPHYMKACPRFWYYGCGFLFLRQYKRADEVQQDAGSPTAGQNSPCDTNDRGVCAQPLGNASADAADLLVFGALVDLAVGLTLAVAHKVLINKIPNGQSSRNRHNGRHRSTLHQ